MSIMDKIPEEIKEEMRRFSQEHIERATDDLDINDKLSLALFYETLNETLQNLDKIEDGPIRQILDFVVAISSALMLTSILGRGMEKKSLDQFLKTEN